MKIRIVKETMCAHDVHEMTNNPRAWFKPKPALPEGTELVVDREWSNFFGFYYRCGEYDIPIEAAVVIEK